MGRKRFPVGLPDHISHLHRFGGTSTASDGTYWARTEMQGFGWKFQGFGLIFLGRNGRRSLCAHLVRPFVAFVTFDPHPNKTTLFSKTYVTFTPH